MPLTPLPTPPSRRDPINFAARADAFVEALPGFVDELNAMAPGANALELAGYLASTAAGKGASQVGVPDAGGLYSGTNVEDVLQEVALRMSSVMISVAEPRFGGVVGDGSTLADKAAVQAAATYAGTLVDASGLDQKKKPILVFPPALGYLTDTMIDIPGGVSVLMHGPLIVRAAAGANITGLRWGNTTTNDQNWRGCVFDLDVRRETQSDWTGGDIGVLILSAFACTGVIRRVDNWQNGCRFTGAYNDIQLGEFRNCGIGLDVQDTACNFANQNKWEGGSFAVVSSVNVNKTRYGIRIGTVSTHAVNTNRFNGQSYELNATGAGTGDAIPIFINAASINTFTSQRSEGNDAPIVSVNGDSRWNFVEEFYNSTYDRPVITNLVDNSTYPFFNLVIPYRSTAPRQQCVFDTGMLSENYVAYDGTTYFFRDCEAIQNTNPATFRPQIANVTINADGTVTTANLSGVIGTRLRTNGCRYFMIEVLGPSGDDLSISMVCFDSSGSQLTSGSSILKDNSATPTITPNTGVAGGLYSLATEPDYPRQWVPIAVAGNVATIYIGISGTSMIGFRIHSVGGRALPFTGASIGYRGELLASQSPQTSGIGSYQVGTRVRRYPAAVGQPKGWMCSTAGSPGTWTSEGNL